MRRQTCTKLRQGFTLLEVLISAMIVTIGILGIASLIPASKYQINEAIRADMAANIGRAAIKTLIAMGAARSDFGNSDITTPNRANTGITNTFGYNWTRTTTVPTNDVLIHDFFCSDDLVQNEKLTMMDETGRPVYDSTLKGDYEWIGTVRRCEKSQTSYCEISAAVSYKRPATPSKCTGSHQSGNIFTIRFTSGDAAEFVPGRWVYVYNAEAAHWYRITDISMQVGYVHLAGPDWDATPAVTIWTPGNVLAAYTEIVPIYTR